VLEVCTDSGIEDQDNVVTRQSAQSGVQVLRLCRELRSLQATLGTEHKEDGRTQVEVVAIDAGGRTLLDHSYEHRIFCSKADDLLELLTEAELPGPSTSSMEDVLDDGSYCPQGQVRTHAGLRSAARARPMSRT